MGYAREKSHHWSIHLLTLGILSLIACNQVETPYRAQSTQEMAAYLAELAREINTANNEYANEHRVRQLTENVKRPSSIEGQLSYRYTLGQELLRAGKSEEAVQTLLEMQQFMQPYIERIPLERKLLVQQQLALAYLRLGEQQNCINAHNVASCLFPIKEEGIHTLQQGSKKAIETYTAVLSEASQNLRARWLLNIAYMTLGQYPHMVPEAWRIPAYTFDADYKVERFYDVAGFLGLDVLALSGGSIMEDFNGDGFLDIMASSWGFEDQLHFFVNNGDGSFRDATLEAGIQGIVGGINMLHADYNNDGFSDVLILRGGWLIEGPPNSLLRNNGDGTFDEVTREAGLFSELPTQTAAWGDYDNDGWLDLVIGNESPRGHTNPAELYHNNQDGTFTDVAASLGLNVIDYVKGVAWGDFDNDGLLDLYVSVLGGENALYHNEGPGTDGLWTFKNIAQQAGVVEPYSSFPVWFWDYDNDGWQDIFVFGYDGNVGDVAAEYLGLENNSEKPRLYHNNGDATFTDVTESVDLARTVFAMGSNFGDIDNDGYLDIYAGTGAPSLESIVPNLMLRNAGGVVFQDITNSTGTGHLQKGHGVAFGDVDNDGDQDLYVVMGGAYSGDIYQNALFVNPGSTNKWITLKLEGVESNRSAIGVRIKITVATETETRAIYCTVGTGGSFGSSSLQQEIGLGDAKSIESIEIMWPTSLRKQVFKNVGMNQVWKIREDDDEVEKMELRELDITFETLLHHLQQEKTGQHQH